MMKVQDNSRIQIEKEEDIIIEYYYYIKIINYLRFVFFHSYL